MSRSASAPGRFHEGYCFEGGAFENVVFDPTSCAATAIIKDYNAQAAEQWK